MKRIQMKDITVNDLDNVQDDHIDLIRDYSKMILYMEKQKHDGVHATVRLHLNNVGFSIHRYDPIISWLPFLQKKTTIHYFKIPRFIDVVEDIRFVSIESPNHWSFMIDNHISKPGHSLYILNKYLSYVRIENMIDYHADIEILCTCIIYHPTIFPKLWESYNRWYYYLPLDITGSTIHLELFQCVDLYFFQPFCLGLQNTAIVSKRNDRDYLVITVATKDRKELLHELIFHKFPFLNLYLFNENQSYPINIKTTLVYA